MKSTHELSDEDLFAEEYSYSATERDQLEALYNETFKDNQENSISEGRIVNITDRDVAGGYRLQVRRVGCRWTSLKIPRRLTIGDTIEVFIEKFEGPGGTLMLSKEACRCGAHLDVAEAARE